MKLVIDTSKKTLTKDIDGEKKVISLYTREAFELISAPWLKVGWNQKYIYTFSWMGRPIIQLPEDVIRIQEAIYQVKPDIIIETGIAHGGGLIFYASLCKAMGKGRVVGVDIEIRPHNRAAIEKHELFPYITLIEGDSVDPKIVNRVKSLLNPGETVLIVLDSNHTKEHVLNELTAYAPLVTTGSYIVAADSIIRDAYDTPRGKSDWTWNHPGAAASEFAAKNPNFIIEQPKWPFNESELTKNVTHWAGGYLKRIK